MPDQLEVKTKKALVWSGKDIEVCPDDFFAKINVPQDLFDFLWEIADREEGREDKC